MRAGSRGERVENRRGGRGGRRWRHVLLGSLFGVLLAVLGPWQGALAVARTPALVVGGGRTIPISAQPFYPELLQATARWSDAPLGQVVGESPRETLLNFYAVMARVDRELGSATRQPQGDPGWFWGPAAQRQIAEAQKLFALAVRALDGSAFPESVRDDMAEEAAIQLKQVLDYVFTHSTIPLHIPDLAEFKILNSQRSKASESWTLPETAITLSSEPGADHAAAGFRFSRDTVGQVGRMYAEISQDPVLDQPFASPEFYRTYSTTPGDLVPPKWYLQLPTGVRRSLELSLYGQTLFQIAITSLTLALYGWLLLAIFRRLLHTYRYWQSSEEQARRSWHQDNLAWYRVLLTLPVMPITRLVDVFIDHLVNITGVPLVIVTFFFFICYFIAASCFFFFLFEALGRSVSEWLVRLRGGGSELQLRRVSNLVMPVCRVLGGFVAVVLIYRLLIVLGLPTTTVLAFSAVPGLAIGLGASKLLGNLFAGLSIQTDRPLRVGEFCRIGSNLGFVTKIGLRSLELQTLESRITIPNAIADEETIVNYSRRSADGGDLPVQSLEVRLTIENQLSPEQVVDLLQLVREHVQSVSELIEPLVSIEQIQSDQLTLICVAHVTLNDWPAYLAVREALLLRLQQLVDQVRLSTLKIGVSYDTTVEQLRQLPELISGVVHRDPHFALQCCRLMAISEFSYDVVVRLHSSHGSLALFKDGIDRLNRDLLASLAAEGIEIPFPTAIEIQRHG